MSLPKSLSVALVALATVQAGSFAQAETLKLTTVQSIGSLATYIAADKGYFKKYGVDVEIERLQVAFRSASSTERCASYRSSW